MLNINELNSKVVDNDIAHITFQSAEEAKEKAYSFRTENDCKLTVVVPCFNSSEYISATCSSLIASAHYSALNVIIVDDGSTDNSVSKAIDIFKGENVRLKIISIPNSGLSAARNIGLKFVGTEYVSFLDSDDLIAPMAYGQMLKLAEADNCDQVFARSSVFHDRTLSEEPFYDSWIWERLLNNAPSFSFFPKSVPMVFASEPKICSRIWRTQFLRNDVIEFPEGRMFEDIGVHLQSLAVSRKIGVVNVQGLYYRSARPSAITSKKSRARFDVLDNISYILNDKDILALDSAQGGYALMSIDRISNWCRTNIDLRMREEFQLKLSETLSKVPAHWEKSYFKLEHRAANAYLRRRIYGRPFSEKLSAAKLWVSRNLKSKPRPSQHAHNSYGSPTDLSRRGKVDFYSNEKALGLSVVFALSDHKGVFAFFDRNSTNLALRIAQARPQAKVYILSPNVMDKDIIIPENISVYDNKESMIDTLIERGETVSVLKISDAFNAVDLRNLSNIKISYLIGTFDAFSEPSTADFLHICRNTVTHGYQLRRTDGQMYSYNGETQRPAVSVVVPVYNILPYLDECVKSLSAQTLRDREIILVDDGATDGSAKRCDEWAKLDSTIRVIHKVNGGCASARMEGYIHAKGQYITFIDGDDWADPNMLRKLYHTALITGDDIVEGGWCFAYPSGNNDDRTDFERTQSYYGRNSLLWRRKHASLTNQPTIWRRLYRRSFLVEHGIVFDTSLRRFDDMPFQFETIMRSNDIAYVDECLLYYRQNREGQDIGVTDDRLYVHFPIMARMRESALLSGDMSTYKAFLELQWNTHNWAMEKISDEFRHAYQGMMVRDIFGPEQLGGSKETLNLLKTIFPRQKRIVKKLHRDYTKYADVNLPASKDLR